MSGETPIPDDHELLAAELAFGLLDAGDRSAVEARLAHDAALADAYRRWQERAAALAAGVDEAPRPSIWSAIEARLPANDSSAAKASRTSVRWWQASTLGAAAAAIIFAIASVRSPLPQPPVPVVVRAPEAAPLVAVLTGTADKGIVTVSYDRTSGRLLSAPAGIDIKGRSAELWVIPAGQSPRSLGVIAAGSPDWRPAPASAAPAIVPGATLAISIEPIGGSPSGKPTGPVILTGKVAAV